MEKLPFWVLFTMGVKSVTLNALSVFVTSTDVFVVSFMVISMRVPPVNSILRRGPGLTKSPMLTIVAIAEMVKKYLAGLRKSIVKAG